MYTYWWERTINSQINIDLSQMHISDVHKNEADESTRGSRGVGCWFYVKWLGMVFLNLFVLAENWRKEGGEMKGPEETRRLVFLHRGREGRKAEGWQKGRVGRMPWADRRRTASRSSVSRGVHRYWKGALGPPLAAPSMAEVASPRAFGAPEP